MNRAYINAAMQHARIEMINQPNYPYYGEIPGLQGVMACGATLEECRASLEDSLEAWLVLGRELCHPIPDVTRLR